jgi:hypothetical protein
VKYLRLFACHNRTEAWCLRFSLLNRPQAFKYNQ